MRDWHAWHAAYDDPASALSRRLGIVQDAIAAWLDERPGELRAISACAGEGRDLLEVLAARPDAGRVRALLVERDPRNVEAARRAVAAHDLGGIEVLQADAGLAASYTGATPADLLLLCGVFGNVSEADIERTIAAAPALCAPGARVIWTRSRRAPDLTPRVRAAFAAAGFAEEAFHAVDDSLFSVGVERLEAAPAPFATAPARLFTFTR
jgi:hypothetical protein